MHNLYHCNDHLTAVQVGARLKLKILLNVIEKDSNLFLETVNPLMNQQLIKKILCNSILYKTRFIGLHSVVPGNIHCPQKSVNTKNSR